MAGQRREVGYRRIDAAIEHFVPMGFKEIDVRNTINSLLKNVYGNDGWPFLEDNCYDVVKLALLEHQVEEEKLQPQVPQKKQQQQEDEEEKAQHVQEQKEEEREEDSEDQIAG